MGYKDPEREDGQKEGKVMDCTAKYCSELRAKIRIVLRGMQKDWWKMLKDAEAPMPREITDLEAVQMTDEGDARVLLGAFYWRRNQIEVAAHFGCETAMVRRYLGPECAGCQSGIQFKIRQYVLSRWREGWSAALPIARESMSDYPEEYPGGEFMQRWRNQSGTIASHRLRNFPPSCDLFNRCECGNLLPKDYTVCRDCEPEKSIYA